MGNNDVRSQSLDLLRFPLAVTVLAVHVFSTTGIIIGDSVCHDFLLKDVQCFVNVFLRGQSVPIYYFISGYVFFLGVDLTRRKYFDKLKNRVKTLLIPFLIFNVICILLSLLVAFARNMCIDGFTLKTFFSCFFAYDGKIPGTTGGLGLPILGPTWFLRDLMVVVICTPLLNIVLKKNGCVSICLFALIWLWSRLLGFNIYMPCSALFFFSFGAYMSINKKDMIVEFGKVNRFSIILYSALSLILIFLCTSNLFSSEIYVGVKSINIFLGLIVYFNLAVSLIKRGLCKVNKLLATSSFFIYITHTMICGRLLKILFIVFSPQTSLSVLLCFIMAIILSVIILVYIYVLMKRYTPRLLTFVTGRR